MGLFKIIGGWLGGVFTAAPVGPGGPVTIGPAFHPAGRTFTVEAEDRTFAL